jgi:signal transduction histidine kinase
LVRHRTDGARPCAQYRFTFANQGHAVPSFIIEHLDEITAEWEAFARTVSPASATMDSAGLRDHVRQMLQAIATDIETWQSSDQQDLKSRGLGTVVAGVETAAESHGALRQTVGFDLSELVAEFRALRATVLRLWMEKKGYGDAASAYEIARFNEAIDQALAESVGTYSQELGKSRDTFLAILGHDLRSPLNAIAGALQVLSGRAAEADRAQALASANRCVRGMGGMIADLLEYTRSRLGKGIPITRSHANLEQVCKSAIAELALAYPQASFRFEAGAQLDGMFDSTRMHQVVSNLLNNAVQRGKRGSPVFMSASSDNYNLILQVKDRGVLAPETLQVIFDPLVQVPSDDDAGRVSLGLGLYIAREVVLAHQGTIHAESSTQDGTTFTVELPCAIHAVAEGKAPGATAGLAAAAAD